MSQQLNKIKKRIKSVKSSYKVTSAMKLVSTVKLKKYRNKMLANKEYSLMMDKITRSVLSGASKVETPFSVVNTNANKNLYIVISSTLGLCGSYNNNIFKVAEANITKEDDAIILGNKAISYFKNGEFNKVEDFSTYTSINDEKIIKSLVNYITDSYSKGEYREIHLIYTEYKNSLVFLPKDYTLLPLKAIDSKEDNIPPLLEPSESELVEMLVPIFIQGQVYSRLLESEVCEQAARANAMENATDNASELLNNLQIEFNKARQAAITQEITEIVGAANAL